MDTIPEGYISRVNTILYCKHFQQTVCFYRDKLKLPVNYKTDWIVEFKVHDRAFLSVANAKRTSIKTSEGSGITLSFKVDDLEKSRSALLHMGVKASVIKSIWNSKSFYFYDPENHRIEFWS